VHEDEAESFMTEVDALNGVMTRASARRRDLLLKLTAVNAALLVLLWIAANLVAERYWLSSLLLYMPHHGFALPTLLLLLWSALDRQVRITAANLLVLIAFPFCFLSLKVPLKRTSLAAEKHVRVMTCNIEHASGGVRHIAHVVQRLQPDVLCLQEADAGEGRPDPMPQLRQMLPGWHRARYGELVTFSRHPFTSHRIHRLPTRVGSGILEATIDVEGRPLTVFNVHFNIPVDGTDGWTPLKMHSIAVVRAQQKAVLLKAASRATLPFIIMGDFNTPPRGLLYRDLANRFTDSFSTAGLGLGHTWHSRMPLTRIDYIFTGPGIRATHCRILEDSISDHRLLYGELALHAPSEH
jgi:vancomycin resistance protein VanJ